MKPGRHRQAIPPRGPWGYVLAAVLLVAYAGPGVPLTAFAVDPTFHLAEPWWLVLVLPCLAGFIYCCNKALTVE